MFTTPEICAMITQRSLTAAPLDRQVRRHSRLFGRLIMLLILVTGGVPNVLASDTLLRSEGQIAQHAKTAWEQGTLDLALGILERGIEDHPQALALHHLRGDMLATSRQTEAALESYDTVLNRKPAALDVRWAKWSLLVRSGQVDASVAELQRIAALDPQNPLIHLRLARELRKLDRLEESFEAYKKAVELGPDMLNWRLAMARARFDILDYEGAERDVHFVLERVVPGSDPVVRCAHAGRLPAPPRGQTQPPRGNTVISGLHPRVDCMVDDAVGCRQSWLPTVANPIDDHVR